MYNVISRHRAHGHVHGHPQGCGCGCRREEFNFYTHPGPINKDHKRLDTTQLTIHTDEIKRKVCLRQPCHCCEPMHGKFKDKKKSFIISAATRCLEPNTYYTLQIDREVPFEAFALDTYINVEPCGFFRGEVGFNETKLTHWGRIGGGPITGEHENLEHLGIDRHGFGEHEMDEIGEHPGHNGEGCIPKDPSQPGQHFVDCGFHTREGVLVPVTLDLLGNIATGKNFSTGRFTVPGVGHPYNNRFVLYYNNRGNFILTRNWRRRSDFA